MAYRLAVDVGGTFIDFALLDEKTGQTLIEKAPSSGDLTERFFEGIERLGMPLAAIDSIVHGSTTVVNTILQERGARTGLVTTQGFRDVYELGRGNRPQSYNLFYKPPAPLVPRYLRLEVPERLDAHGRVLTPLDEASARAAVEALKQAGVEAIAIAFLHSYANPVHEERMAQIAREVFPGAAVTISSEITREWREFERTSTTVLNAYTRKHVDAYLGVLEQKLAERAYRGSFNVMQSTGGMTSGDQARAVPLRMLESGPAGGVIGAVRLGQQLGEDNLIAADVGGTTFDVSVIIRGEPLQKNDSHINHRPVQIPCLDIVSIGAGGGSIAWLDAEGGLRVGPASAQAVPGPACYGLGGTEATVTDAQLLLGYLDPDYYLGRRMKLDRAAAEQAVGRIGGRLGLDAQGTAHGIIQIASMNMTYAIRNITIERGHDPREFSLVCYGGGGGLFAGALLSELEAKQAIVPVFPAAFSAWGLLNADYREDAARMVGRPLAAVSPRDLRDGLAELDAQTRAAVERCGAPRERQHFLRYAELRYSGQEHTLRVPLEAADLEDSTYAALRERFHRAHEQAYAHALPHRALDLLKLHVAAVGNTSKPIQPRWEAGGEDALKGHRDVLLDRHSSPYPCPVYDRERLAAGAMLRGPLIVEEWSSTVLALPGQQLAVDTAGDLIITREN